MSKIQIDDNIFRMVARKMHLAGIDLRVIKDEIEAAYTWTIEEQKLKIMQEQQSKMTSADEADEVATAKAQAYERAAQVVENEFKLMRELERRQIATERLNELATEIRCLPNTEVLIHTLSNTEAQNEQENVN